MLHLPVVFYSFLIFSIILCCGNNSLFAKSAREIFFLDAPQSDEPKKEIAYEKIDEEPINNEKGLFECIKGIVLLRNEKSMLLGHSLKHIEGLQTIDVDVPGGTKGLAERLKPYYCDRPLGQEDILRIIDEISRYYNDHMRPLVVVEVPRQEVSSKVLQLIITESKLGDVRVEGTKRKGSERVKNYVQLTKGDTIDETTLLKNLQFMNRNPFRRVDYIYTPGEETYTTDLILYTEDRRPVRFYVGGDNSGVPTTGTLRWFAGINASYLFADDNFSYQYTTSSNFHKLQAHTVQYLLLLPWQQLINIYGGYSSVHANLSFPGSKNHGQSSQASFRYIMPLLPSRSLNHEVSTGFDYKRTNNNLEFSDAMPEVGQTVNLTQLAGKYAGNYEGRRYRIDYDMELYWSPGKWLPDQTNSDFSSLRPGAKNHWVYGRAAFTYSQQMFRGFWWFSMLRGQLSGDNLIPSEQLGIGGYDTVRGYAERELNKDSGFISNIEIRSPSMRLFFRKRTESGRAKDGLQFLGFFDYGIGGNHHRILNEPRTQFLMGAGPGIRYTMNDWFTGRFDWGFKLHKEKHFLGGNNMVYFQVVASY